MCPLIVIWNLSRFTHSGHKSRRNWIEWNCLQIQFISQYSWTKNQFSTHFFQHFFYSSLLHMLIWNWAKKSRRRWRQHQQHYDNQHRPKHIHTIIQRIQRVSIGINIIRIVHSWAAIHFKEQFHLITSEWHGLLYFWWYR